MIHLDYRDSRPIYEQVKDGLRHLVVTGVMVPGDKLPSHSLPSIPTPSSGPTANWKRRDSFIP